MRQLNSNNHRIHCPVAQNVSAYVLCDRDRLGSRMIPAYHDVRIVTRCGEAGGGGGGTCMQESSFHVLIQQGEEFTL
jgi:hypothetical protein